jgi:hypothetical protein
MQEAQFLLDFVNAPVDKYKYTDVKEIGMEIDWFSHVFGRTIIAGILRYETYKNYRCKKEFNKNVTDNRMDVPTLIFIHDWTTSQHTYTKTLDKFGTFQNLFNNNKDFEQYSNRMIFNIKPPNIKKNGKPDKHFNVQRKKRFRIPVVNGMTSDDRVIKATTISCTFRNVT